MRNELLHLLLLPALPVSPHMSSLRWHGHGSILARSTAMALSLALDFSASLVQQLSGK